MDVDLITNQHALYRWNTNEKLRRLFAKSLSELAMEDLIKVKNGVGRDFCAEPLSSRPSQVALVEGVCRTQLEPGHIADIVAV